MNIILRGDRARYPVPAWFMEWLFDFVESFDAWGMEILLDPVKWYDAYREMWALETAAWLEDE